MAAKVVFEDLAVISRSGPESVVETKTHLGTSRASDRLSRGRKPY